jgi:hypothetical protein
MGEVDDAERDATVAKLKAERKKLLAEHDKLIVDRQVAEAQLGASAQRRENWKAVAGIGGMVSGLAAAIALFVSSGQWLALQHQQRLTEADQRLQTALVLSSDASPSKRLSGVTLLGTLVRGSDQGHQEQALLALSNILVLESDQTVRDAIIESFKDAHAPKPVLDRTLASLIAKSRNLVVNGTLYGRPQRDDRHPNTTLVFGGGRTSHGDIVKKARTVATAMLAVLSNGGSSRSFQGIYCAGCDFAAGSYDGVNFDRAVLYGATFRGTSMRNTSFVDADLSAADFQSADLTGAKFDTSKYWLDRFRDESGWSHWLVRLAHPDVLGPVMTNFACADLRGASFAGFPIAGARLPPVEAENRAYLEPASFSGANLAGADLTGAVFLSYRSGMTDMPAGYETQLDEEVEGGYLAAVAFPMLNPDYLPNGAADAKAMVERPLAHTNWSAARLAPTIRPLLKTPSEAPPRERCAPRAPW